MNRKRYNPTPSDVLWLANVKSDPCLSPMQKRKWARAYKRALQAQRSRLWREKITELVGMAAVSFVSVAVLLLLLFGLN